MKKILLSCVILMQCHNALSMKIDLGDDYPALFKQANKYLSQYKHSKASRVLEWLCAHDTDPKRKLTAHIHLAAAYRKIGYSQDAKIQLKLLLDQDIHKEFKSAGAFGLGLLAVSNHKLTKAAEYFLQAAELASVPKHLEEARNQYLAVLKVLRPQTKFDDTEEIPAIKDKKRKFF